MEQFTKELTALINKYAIENQSDIPDYILANYLVNCLQNFNEHIIDLKDWQASTLLDKGKTTAEFKKQLE
jgi:hypothetical protein